VTITEVRQASAQRFADKLGLDGEALYRAALAAWSNLNPQSVPFDHALSVAAVALKAAGTSPASELSGTPLADALAKADAETENHYSALCDLAEEVRRHLAGEAPAGEEDYFEVTPADWAAEGDE
jgi:hypothetical protein